MKDLSNKLVLQFHLFDSLSVRVEQQIADALIKKRQQRAHKSSRFKS